MSARAWVGTSGFEYAHWRDSFYGGLPRTRWLDFYTSAFDTVELNATFYRLPDAETFERWRQRTPHGFRFAVKASRYLTHVKRLADPAEPLDRLWTRSARLGDRLGPMLYQLPPRWLPNLERLDAFLAQVPADRAQAVEIRDRRWYRPEIMDALTRAGVGLCLHDMAGSETTPTPIGPIAYVRFHGAGARYGGRYSSQRLAAWAERIRQWTDADLPTWAYFNNDIGGHAFRDAARLREMLARRGVRC